VERERVTGVRRGAGPGGPPLPQPAPIAPSAPHASAQQLVDAADLSGENYLVVEELRSGLDSG
jgi:hypothetical protein